MTHEFAGNVDRMHADDLLCVGLGGERNESEGSIRIDLDPFNLIERKAQNSFLKNTKIPGPDVWARTLPKTVMDFSMSSSDAFDGIPPMKTWNSVLLTTIQL